MSKSIRYQHLADLFFREGGVPARNQKGERLLLFLGIIDILQNYRLFKKLEHTWKSILHDGDSISVHNPSFYAERFQTYLGKRVFIRGWFIKLDISITFSKPGFAVIFTY
jgi:hypothetical protein